MKIFLVVAILFLISCATTLNPSATVTEPVNVKYTTLPFDSEIDPNIFYYFIPVSEPALYATDSGEEAYLIHLKNPDSTQLIQYASVFITADLELLVYGYELRGEIFIYRIDREKQRYVRHIPSYEEENEGGI